MARSKSTMFTDTMIRKLKPEVQKYLRSEGNGFSVRVMPSGVKTFVYLYSLDGKRRELKLGNYPEVTLETARGRFEGARTKVKNGIDPIAEKEKVEEERRKAPTVSDLVDDYIARHAKRFKKSWEKDQAILSHNVIPAWGKRKAGDIAKRDVLELLEGIVMRNAPAMANNCFQVIRKMFNWSVEQDILMHSPCAGVKLPSPKVLRERALSETEIKKLWTALDTPELFMSASTRRALKLILVTAQRPGEVIGLHSREIDGRWWIIPSDRAKNGKTHRVYLTDTALQLIGPLEEIDEETGETKAKGFIFPSPVKKSKKQPKKKAQPLGDTALAVAVGRNLAFPVTDKDGKQLNDSKGNPVTENKIGIDHFTPHDLRRTAATFMAEMGAMDEVIDAILNHAKQGVIKVYNQYRYDREKQHTLEAWERKLLSLLHGQEAKLVFLSSHKKVA